MFKNKSLSNKCVTTYGSNWLGFVVIHDVEYKNKLARMNYPIYRVFGRDVFFVAFTWVL